MLIQGFILQAIIKANGSPLRAGSVRGKRKTLLTCAIRSAGIYGEGEVTLKEEDTEMSEISHTLKK